MKTSLKWGEVLFRYIFLLFFLYSCATPEERAIKVPVSDSTVSSPVYPGTAGPELHVVEIKDMKFQPEEISVKKGDTVMWINRDMVTHCVTEENKKAWTSSNIAAGASWKMVVENSADYFCAIHQVMKGKIIVQ
jgi:plastocyanin